MRSCHGDLYFLVGPTAARKTEVGVELATLLDAEIVSMDSMAVYEGMDIGTAKPSRELRARVPHHLIDIRKPSEHFDVADYVRLAKQAVIDIRARGRKPLLVGGTYLYLKALTEGLFEGPAADLALRARLQSEAGASGTAALHARLKVVDPIAAARIHPNDLRRIIRALEVYEITGRPLSSFQTQFGAGNPLCRTIIAGLSVPREIVRRRIAERVEAMFRAGLVEEVRRIRESTGFGRQASQALGYKEVLDYLDGKRDIEETIALVERRTCRFAKQQMTWLRSFKAVQWMEASADDTPTELARKIWEVWHNRTPLPGLA